MVLVIGQGLKVVIDEGFSKGQERLLDQTLATLAALIAALGVLTWFRVYNVYWIGARFTADLGRGVYDHLVTLSPGFYEEARTGEVSSRVTNDVTLIEAVMGGTLLYALRMAITMVGCAAMLLVTSVKLTVLALAAMPLVLLPIGLLGLRVRRLSRAVQDRVADVSTHVDETLHEIRTVQAFTHEAVESATFGARVEPALARFSLAIDPGEVVALVGPSGAGKTTVFQLLLRFYDPDAGVVRVDGVDARAANPRELRRRIAVVAQDPVIFASSVLDNVRYGRPEASDAEARDALALANALEFVDRLPEGLATPLGERGVKLSGGQRQRIAIARAILADRAILLLDEATSSLDAESEKAVQVALDRLMRGRTTLVIAHRLATVKSSNRIVVIDNGRIVATGTHASLVAENGLYARLAALQFAAATA